MKLLFLKYNNYYNRIKKKEASIGNYESAASSYFYDGNQYNFVQADGVNTQVTFNWTQSWMPDYLVVVDGNTTIKSRWFIMEATMNKKDQYIFSLYRDVIADNWDTVMNSPVYMEKGYPKTLYDPAIFNKEDLMVNQIKQSETLLRDKTKMAWLVAWIDSSKTQSEFTDLFKEQDSSGNTKPKYVPYSRGQEITPDFTTSSINDWKDDRGLNQSYYSMLYNEDYIIVKSYCRMVDAFGGYTYQQSDVTIYSDSDNTTSETHKTGITKESTAKVDHGNNFVDNTGYSTMYSQIQSARSGILSSFRTDLSILIPTSTILSTYVGKYVKDTSTGKLFKISSSATSQMLSNNNLGSGTTTSAYIANHCSNGKTSATYVDFKGELLTFVFTDVTDSQVSTDNICLNPQMSSSALPAPNTNQLIDAPYMGICIPYPLNLTTATLVTKGGKYLNLTKDRAMAAINLISHCLQDGQYLYDAQLLPYCPILDDIRVITDVSGWDPETVSMISAANIDSTRTFKFYKTDGTTFDTTTEVMEAFVFYRSTFTFDITNVISDKSTVMDKKVASDTELYRLCSPNYSGYFEFNPYMNNGISLFNVDCTYKPYKSYLHLNPNFKGLYGYDSNDARGLVITSDFTIPQTTDAWQQYQITNKNYSEIFNRQIQNMDVTNAWELADSVTNALTGVVSGAASGAVTGAMMGGVTGAVAGGVVGGVASTLGGAADVAKTVALQKENRDYTKDLYNLNLQNVQALPNTLSSVSSFDANNKMWPFLEKYDCTDVEKQALIDKITYNGMKIGRVAKLSEFYDSDNEHFYQGQLIRLENTDNDAHEVSVISDELLKGVYL